MSILNNPDINWTKMEDRRCWTEGHKMDNIEELTEIKEQSMELSPIKNLFEIISFCK